MAPSLTLVGALLRSTIAMPKAAAHSSRHKAVITLNVRHAKRIKSRLWSTGGATFNAVEGTFTETLVLGSSGMALGDRYIDT